jgi:hypothetical protein
MQDVHEINWKGQNPEIECNTTGAAPWWYSKLEFAFMA